MTSQPPDRSPDSRRHCDELHAGSTGRPSAGAVRPGSTEPNADTAGTDSSFLPETARDHTRMVAVLQQLPLGVIVVEASTGRVLVMNEAARRLSRPPPDGKSAAQAAGIPPDAITERGSRLVDPNGWPLSRALRDGHVTTNQEMQYVREDGSLGTVLVSAAPIRQGDRIDAAVATFSDVTAQLNATEQLRSASAEASSARAEADRASAAKSEFLSTMSHEIRTPLNAIVGYVQLLEMGVGGTGTDAQRTYLERLRLSSDHLLMLVNEVLDLAKAESGSLALRRGTGSADLVIDEAIALVLPLATQQGVSITHPSYSAVEDVYVGDLDRVRQVLVNLLGNAIKFTPAGGSVLIESGTIVDPEMDREGAPGYLSQGRRWTTITVTDTGVGIPASRLSSIFEPFVQIEPLDEQMLASGHTSPIPSPRRGSGLGLAISRRLARAMGGDLSVRSIERQGSAFTLWLPAPESGSTASR